MILPARSQPGLSSGAAPTTPPPGRITYRAVRDACGQVTDFRLTTLNTTALTVWNQPETSLTGQCLRQLLPDPADHSFLIRQFGLVTEFGRTVRFEFTHPSTPGTAPQPYRLLVSGLDDGVAVQYERLADTGLTAGGDVDLLEKLFENPLMAVAAYEAVRNAETGQIEDFRFLRINAVAAAQRGLTRHQMEGRLASAIYPGHRTKSLFDQYVLVCQTGQPYRTQKYYPDFDIWADVTVVPLRDGVVVTSTDITAQRRAEQEATRQTALLRSVLDNAREGLSVLKPILNPATGQITDYRIVLVNDALARRTSHTVATMQGQSVGDLFPNWQQTDRYRQYEAVWQTGKPLEISFHHTENGTTGWFETSMSRIGEYVLYTSFDVTAIREAEQQRQRQADFYKNVLDNTVASIIAFESVRDTAGTITDFRFTLANKEAVRTAGLPESALLGQNLTELFPGVRQSGQFENSVRIVESRQGQQLEVHYALAADDMWLLVSSTPYADGLLVSFIDITAQKQAELTARQQADLLESIQNSTQVALSGVKAVRDATGAITDFQVVFRNAESARVLALVDQTEQVALPEHRPLVKTSDVWTRFARVTETGHSEQYAIQYEVNGVSSCFEVDLQPWNDGLVVSSLDVSQLRQAEREKMRQARLLQQIMDTTPTAIVVHETIRDDAGEIVDFRMTMLNEGAARLLQNPIDSIRHRRISRYFPGLTTMPLFALYRRVVQTGEPGRLEVAWADRWYDFSVARFGDGLVVATQDITTTRRYRQQLEAANRELQRTNDNLQSFAYIASHDLQEPLRKLTSFADILHTQYTAQLPPEVTDIVQRMNTSAERMRLLIQDLLAYSRVGSRTEPLNLVALDTLLSELRENELWAAFHQSQAELRFDALPTLLANPIQLRQLFQNLLGNAVKFARQGVAPVITVTHQIIDRAGMSAELLPLANLERADQISTRFHEIAVIDNGIGFEEKYRTRIFQVFQRLHGRAQYPGSGVGLAICQKIVEQHGGAITADSQPGKGSTFRIYLPVTH